MRILPQVFHDGRGFLYLVVVVQLGLESEFVGALLEVPVVLFYSWPSIMMLLSPGHEKCSETAKQFIGCGIRYHTV